MNRPKNTDRIIREALKEDRVRQDMTSKLTIPRQRKSTAYIISREAGVLCGIDIAKKVFQKIDPKIKFVALGKDGGRLKAGRRIAKITGRTQSILAAERTALNFLSHLSGIAAQTHRFVQEVKPSRAKIFDTRKTTPGLRLLEKYAVKCGGGENHRASLAEMIFIKDNHWAVMKKTDDLEKLVHRIKQKTKKKIEIEVDTLAQCKKVLSAKPHYILLDNMSAAQLKRAVAIKNKKKQTRGIKLEASGGITLKNVKKIAQTGVDRTSVGELTHTCRCIDFSLDAK